MIKYNLCYIKQQDRVLLLNRNKAGWMGRWNGVGGKLEPGENPLESMRRETLEETGLETLDFVFKGLKTWSTSGGTNFGGLYLYIAELPDDLIYPTPQSTDEGILDWKTIEWTLHPENLGVPDNLPTSMQLAFTDTRCFDYHSVFSGNLMIKETHVEIDPRVETDHQLLVQYLEKYTKLPIEA